MSRKCGGKLNSNFLSHHDGVSFERISVPYIHRLAIMPTTFRLLFYAILDAKEISKVAVACNDTTEYCCLDKTNSW